MDRQLQEMLEEFLENRKESESGGWADVTIQEHNQLDDIIYELICLKWGTDADGDLPIAFKTINKRHFEYSFPLLVPHLLKVKREEMHDVLRVLSSNAMYATERLDIALSIFRDMMK